MRMRSVSRCRNCPPSRGRLLYPDPGRAHCLSGPQSGVSGMDQTVNHSMTPAAGFRRPRSLRPLFMKYLNPVAACPDVLLAPAMILCLIFSLLPVAYVIRSSFYQIDFVMGTESWVGLQNFRSIFSDADFLQAVGNTLIFTFFAVGIGISGSGSGGLSQQEPCCLQPGTEHCLHPAHHLLYLHRGAVLGPRWTPRPVSSTWCWTSSDCRSSSRTLERGDFAALHHHRLCMEDARLQYHDYPGGAAECAPGGV